MIIIHGDNQIASRKVFLDLKFSAGKSGRQVVSLDGSSLTLPDLSRSIESVSLLGTGNSVFIENHFSRRQGKEKTRITDYLMGHLSADIIIWEAKNQSLLLKGFPSSAIKKYDFPPSIYDFLDTFSLAALHRAIKEGSAEQVLSQLSWRINKMILAKENLLKPPSWQHNKIISRSGRYSLPRLFSMQKSLLDIDLSVKSSSGPYSLSTALELWVISL